MIGLAAAGRSPAAQSPAAQSLAAQSPAAPEADESVGGSALEITSEPAHLVRGSLGRLLVHPAPGAAHIDSLTAMAAGEPLHFERRRDGSFAALVAAPIDDTDSASAALEVTLVAHRHRAGAATASSADTTVLALTLRDGNYRRERLTVAPQFARPDSAAAARVADEVAEAHALGRNAHQTPRLWQRRFAAPRPGRVTSRFGTARELNGDVLTRHMGADFAGKVGAPVRAANDGVVALVAKLYLAGNAVYIDHGGGLTTGYFHLSRAEVAAGDTVRRGQIIGRVGRSGRATGPHLHWIARYGEINVDPMSLLRLPPEP
ncbi:MAG TPA: M23 family metallopeptidase [Gemmatimonadales bacterium]|nr:M23 family metallopeptidase [Gemmatimonadales bacterium]